LAGANAPSKILKDVDAWWMSAGLWTKLRGRSPQMESTGSKPMRNETPPQLISLADSLGHFHSHLNKKRMNCGSSTKPIRKPCFWWILDRSGNTVPATLKVLGISPWNRRDCRAGAKKEPWQTFWKRTKIISLYFTERAWHEPAATRRPGWPYHLDIKMFIGIPWVIPNGMQKDCR
jgi:hypothetical protein